MRQVILQRVRRTAIASVMATTFHRKGKGFIALLALVRAGIRLVAKNLWIKVLRLLLAGLRKAAVQVSGVLDQVRMVSNYLQRTMTSRSKPIPFLMRWMILSD